MGGQFEESVPSIRLTVEYSDGETFVGNVFFALEIPAMEISE